MLVPANDTPLIRLRFALSIAHVHVRYCMYGCGRYRKLSQSCSPLQEHQYHRAAWLRRRDAEKATL